MKKYDVAIIGAGPAGLFAALTILKNSRNKTILLVDKGKQVSDRKCCKDCLICSARNCCDVLCGVGGSGLFSDGKLVLDLHSGGKLDSIASLSDKKRHELEESIIRTLKDHDGQSEASPLVSEERCQYWKYQCKNAGLEIKRYDVLHMGTSNLQHITKNLADDICKDSRIQLRTDYCIEKIERDIHGVSTLISTEGEAVQSKHVIFAVGKTGSEWLKKALSKFNVAFYKENTYLGVRLEVPNYAVQRIFSYSFDPKIWAYYDDRKVKTHCFCRNGEVICTNYMGYPVVGGHTPFTKKNGIPDDLQSPAGNFNILVSTKRSNADIISLLESTRQLNPAGILVQSLQNYLNPDQNDSETYIESKKVVKANIRQLLDSFDSIGTIIADFILRLSRLFPDIINSNSKVYAPSIEWYMDSVVVSKYMETSQPDWFTVGDGAGISQGIVHSAATSIIAAEEICRRMKIRS